MSWPSRTPCALATVLAAAVALAAGAAPGAPAAARTPTPAKTAPAKTAPAKTAPAKTTPAKTTPAKTTPKQTPAQARAAALKAGAALFADNGCGACHTLAGARAAGASGPNLDVLGLPAAEIVRQLTRGSIAMPSFRGRLTSAQIAQLAGFVEVTARARGTRPRDAATLFRGYCGTCHSYSPAGTRGALGPSLDGRALTAADVQSAVVVKHSVSLGFGLHLEGAELQAIAAYAASAATPVQPAATTTGS